MGLLTGSAIIVAGGLRLASLPGAKLNIGAKERTGELGDSGILGYTEKASIPFVECKIKHDAATSLDAFGDMVDVTVSFDTDTGKSYVLRNAWRAGQVEMEGGDVPLRFEGMSCEEV